MKRKMSLDLRISWSPFVVALVFCALVQFGDAAQKYYGTHISRLSELHHAVTGDVFAVDSRTIFIKGFSYDGEGPAAYFYVGNTRAPSNIGGFRIRDERGSNGVLKKYRNKDITLTLPEGKTLRDIKWFSIWCDEFSVDFGNVKIEKNLEFPRPQKIGGLKGIHAVQSDNIVIVDAQTLLIPNFSYDGVAPDAKFWVGRGQKPSPNGFRIFDENGKETPLRRYDRKTIVLTLPGDLTIFDIGHFGVWCEAFTVDFGHVRIPDQINVPPSLKMLGISPQSKLNCEVLHDDLAFEVRWAVAGESIVIQLVSKLDDNEYMSFGVSGDTENSVMIGGDVVVAWVNRLSGKGYAQDYFLEAKSQCSGNRGSCPDTRLKDNTNSIRLLNAAIVNDYSIVTYQRPLKSADAFDQTIFVNGSQAIIWAIGPLNQRFEVSYHSQFLKKNKFIDFGRQPFWNCPIPDNEGKPAALEPEFIDPKKPISQKLSNNRLNLNQGETNAADNNGGANSNSNDRKDVQRRPQAAAVSRPVPTPRPASKKDAWDIPPIQCYEPEDGVFYAQMGPTGGKMGYPAITGHVGWGISWYINGLLIPEINLVRGKTYTFVVEGGNDPDTPAKYHPFYITDDPVGGYEYKTEQERDNVKVFAGIHKSRNGKITPTGVGRICNWTPDQSGPQADAYTSFGAYQRSLTLKCDEGEPGILTWTPDADTPDTVYYQCFTHRYLGWKINILDSCDEQPAASEIDEVYVDAEDAVIAEPSIKHESKLYPSDNFLQQHEKDLIKHHNMNGATPKVTVDTKTSEISKLITEGIRTAELLEESVKNKGKLNVNNTRPTQSNFKNNQYLPLSNTKTNEEDTELLEAISKIPQTNQGNQGIPGNQGNQGIQANQGNQGNQGNHGKPGNQGNHGPPMNHQYQGNKHQQRPMFTSSGLPVFLRPPQNQNAPFYRPVKLPARRPIALERRPMNNQRPYLLPQQSIIVNHYKKPMGGPMGGPKLMGGPMVGQQIMSSNHYPNGIRNYQKNKHHQSPPKSMPSVLLLGEPTEIKPFKKSSSDLIIGKPSKTQIDVSQAYKIKKTSISSPPPPPPQQPQQPPIRSHQYQHKIPSKSDKIQVRNPWKEPFEVKNDSTLFREASNTGFKADSVIVEGGFRPIFRREDILLNDEAETESEESIGTIPVIQRRMDNDFEVESLESDILFLMNEEPSGSRFFEPMFIPSPLDSPQALAQVNDSRESDFMIEDGEDKMAMAANERQDFFYLPPNDSKRSAVSYDAKAVLDTSLLNDPLPNRNDLTSLSIKTKQFIKDTPQFATFKGELPSDLILQLKKNRPDSSSSSLTNVIKEKLPVISTKLSAVIKSNSTSRRKREAHEGHDHSQHDHSHAMPNGATKFPSNSLIHLVISALLAITLFL